MKDRKDLAHAGFLTLDRHLPLSDWDPADQTRGWFHVLRSRLSVQIALSFAVLSIVAGVALNWALDPGHGQATPFALSLPWLALQSIAAALVFLAMLAGLFVAALRWKERNDPVDQSRPTMDHLRALAEREDLPGHVKNHITVVTPLKPGLVFEGSCQITISMTPCIASTTRTMVQSSSIPLGG